MSDTQPDGEGGPRLFVGETKVKVELEELSPRSQNAVKGMVEELGFSIDEISSITVEMGNPLEEEEK